MNTMNKLIVGASLLVSSCGFFPAFAAEEGTITIPYSEYEKMKKATEVDGTEQYWNMTFEQILKKEKGNKESAWKIYDYYVLRNIHLDAGVDGGIVDRLIKEIEVLNQIDDTKPITMIINSPGGSVFDGFNLYNAMMASKAPVNTVCDGIAASMASVLLSAGDHRTAYSSCAHLVHQMGGNIGGGQTDDMIKYADWFVTIENILNDIYTENTGLSRKEIHTLGEFETFWNAEETLRLGFVDEVVSNKPRQMKEGSRTIPEDLLPRKRLAKQLNERF